MTKKHHHEDSFSFHKMDCYFIDACMNECILGHNQIISLLYNCTTNINQAVCAWEGSQYRSAMSQTFNSAWQDTFNPHSQNCKPFCDKYYSSLFYPHHKVTRCAFDQLKLACKIVVEIVNWKENIGHHGNDFPFGREQHDSKWKQGKRSH